MEGIACIGLVLFVMLNPLIGALIGQSKNRVIAGAFFGFLLGPIGWLIVALGPNLKRKCPHCAEPISSKARVCKHCGRDLSAPIATSTSVNLSTTLSAKVPVPITGNWYCPSCGKQMNDTDSFCSGCGRPKPTTSSLPKNDA